MSLVLAFDDDAAAAATLAAALQRPMAVVRRHRFPDGETRLHLPPTLPPHVVLLRGLQQPDARLAELLLAAGGARELGATRLTLVCPYLGYMRQDSAFSPGEVVSQRHLGRLLAAAFDDVLTVDPHLHRVLSAAPALGEFVGRRRPGALLLGPDEESMQWVRAAARPGALEHAVCVKQRRGDHEVEVALPAVDVRGRAVVLFDDVASTGRTLIAAARGALGAGAASVDAAVVHALFVGDALDQVHAAGVREVWSADGVPHPSNVVSVLPLLAEALRALG